MDRVPAVAVDATLRASLRANPIFAGVPDDTLDQIARLVAASSVRKITDALRKVPLFEGISEEDALRIQEVGRTVSLATGETLFEEGKKGETFYVVLRGRVELLKRGRDGAEQKLAVAREGEAFGEMALLNRTPRSATARAIEDSQLLEISRDAFDTLLGADSFPVRMLRGTSKALWAMSVRFASHQGQGVDARGLVRGLSRVMQKSMLPAGLPQVPGFAVFAATGADERSEGDSAWDWFHTADGRLRFAALRARSDGLPAGSLLILARTLLRELGKDGDDPARLLARVNDALVGARVAGAHQSVDCALVGVEERELGWAAAGRVPAALVRSGGAVEALPADAPPLGMEAGASFAGSALAVSSGDTLVSVVRAAPGALDQAAALLTEARKSDLRKVAKRLAASLPADDPVTGDVFDNTILLLRCVSQPPAEAAEGAASARAADHEEVVRSRKETSATR